MSDLNSRTVCAVDCGGTANTLSHVLAAFSRKRAHMETSVMCLSVTLAPLDRKACFKTLDNKMDIIKGMKQV